MPAASTRANRALPRRPEVPSLLGRSPEEQVVFAARYVTLERFETLSGYTTDAVHGKIARGQWLLEREFIKAPDGRLLVDLVGYGAWARGTRA